MPLPVLRAGTARSLALTLTLVFGMGLGWFLKDTVRPTTATPSTCLRLQGYEFIKPLLACDINATGTSPAFTKTKQILEQIINAAKKQGAITSASVYVRDLTNHQELRINADETFYPASLKKVPLLMQYYKESEANPGLLLQSITITDPTDYNDGTTIQPKEAAQFGKTYTNAELMRLMIQNSDNTSFQILLRNLGTEKFNQAYSDLQLHYPDNLVSIDDYMTPYQFSLFFRTLFNATYLNRANSEAALSLLSGVEYKNALVSGVPKSVTVAHKFGIGVVSQKKGGEQGELHDCGIIYKPEHPYLFCAMTKSTSLDITVVERLIADLSHAAYEAIGN